jgi:pilus assembly protein Flp/PilA
MRKWLERLARFVQEEDGPTAVEYAVMLALIIVVCLAAIGSLGTSASASFGNSALNTAAAGS